MKNLHQVYDNRRLDSLKMERRGRSYLILAVSSLKFVSLLFLFNRACIMTVCPHMSKPPQPKEQWVHVQFRPAYVRSWSVPPEHWYDAIVHHGSVWLCGWVKERASVGGNAAERQVCVGDRTKGRGEQWCCQVVPKYGVGNSLAIRIQEAQCVTFQLLGKSDGRVCGIKQQTCEMVKQLHWLKWEQINGVRHMCENPWVILLKIQC